MLHCICQELCSSELSTNQPFLLCKVPADCLLNYVCNHSCLQVLYGGKHVKNGREQYISFSRHKNYLLCPCNSLACFLWQRFVVGKECFPNPAKRDEWWACVLFSLTDGKTPVSYETLLQEIRRLFDNEHVGVTSTKVCHSFRGAGAKHLQAHG